MSKVTSIIEAIEDLDLFGSLFKDQSTWKNWKGFLESLFGLPMTKEELKVYKTYTNRQIPPQKPFKEAFAIVGRRGGKSFISSITACYLALFRDWDPFLAPGETGWIMCIASDKQQAKVILEYIKAILRLRIFRELVQKELTWEVRLKNRVTISVKTCDYRTLRGYTVIAAICDEIAFWRGEGANPDKEILTALRPALATVPDSLLLGISTPYSKTGALYEAFHDKYGQDDSDVLVWKAPTRIMNPTISEKIIERDLKDDYTSAKAEWLAEFREDIETFLPSEMIEASVVLNRWMLPKIEGTKYFAFTDPSGGRGDSFTLAIAHKDKETKNVFLDRQEEQRPPFSPRTVVEEFSRIIKSYGVSRVTGDKYAGEWVSNAFKECGITFSPLKLTKSELYLEFLPLMAQGQIELLDNKRLINQLRSLERRSRSGGKDIVDHPPGSHDDLANAAAGAVYLACKKEPRKGRVFTPY